LQTKILINGFFCRIVSVMSVTITARKKNIFFEGGGKICPNMANLVGKFNVINCFN